MSAIQEALRDGVVVFDGAMGTEIYKHNVRTNTCFDGLCLSAPRIIESIHEAYRAAGADVLTTNTFGANRAMLAAYGMEDELLAINDAAVRIARAVADATDRRIFVAGSIGPAVLRRPDQYDLREVYAEQARALTGAGADFILFETQRSRAGIEACATAMTRLPDTPFALSFTVFENGESEAGEPLAVLMAPLPGGTPTPAAWGINCGIGPDALLSAARQAVRLTDLPLIAQPNAGHPREVGGRQIYFCSPDYMADYAQRFLAIGVAGIGGCCGTTPDHIREVARRIKPMARMHKPLPLIEPVESAPLRTPTPLREKSRFAHRLAEKGWVATVEILPPRGYDLTETIEKARTLHRHGVDALNIPDGPRASSRISPLTTASIIVREAQIEPILHFCCRDRNLIGIQADLLACAAHGIRNLLFVTGDPPKMGNYPSASGVFDMDSIGLCRAQRRLNQGIDIGGQPIEPATHTVIGVGADPTALDADREIERFHRKVEAGAEFAITQPVFEPEMLFRFLDAVEDCPIPVLAGIWPLASYRNALFLQNEVPGVTVPNSVLARMEAAGDRESQRLAGIEMARESVEHVRGRVAGIQVSAPFGNVATALAVIEN
ncbi:MAG TPA: bifunctional homocysteine S-methyltransferase/methylenetetrahydrofolate reductase [Candidatus Hydrogenedentes bacterium]|nr:bifunctional homocysteine S-methyltransferase/methylenetetrahydrofolate reductase [Candidatus Hydrogenedentota bacterium]HPG68907.1 bifunctional homocysteine S-methyltransferase/methylenetetrahydrofolate reductase [Candidatus Hydrogenedentota bacterium]